jgi:ribosomal protein L21E
MKNLKDIFESTLELDERYSVGDNIAFNIDDVAKANPKMSINDDSGQVLKVTAKGYIVKSHLDDSEFTVPEKAAIAYGSAGADSAAG